MLIIVANFYYFHKYSVNILSDFCVDGKCELGQKICNFLVVAEVIRNAMFLIV